MKKNNLLLLLVALFFHLLPTKSQTINSLDTLSFNVKDLSSYQKIVDESGEEYYRMATAKCEVKEINSSSIVAVPQSETSQKRISSLKTPSLLASIPTNVEIDKTKAVGEIKLLTSVNNGIVSHSVPIEHGNSTNLKSQISIAYSSASKNEIAGYGWGIGGLSFISIANSNYYYDGANYQGAKLNKSSAYVLDGIRLIKLSEDDQHITLQSESGLMKVINYAPSGKYYFEVFYPDGNKAIYGYETDVEPQISYPMTQIENTLGNSIKYIYEKIHNYYYISNVSYLSNNNIAESIKFHYTSKESPDFAFVDGKEIKTTRLLNKIEVFHQENLLRTYELKHITALEQYPEESSFLDQITCKSGNEELNPLRFSYETSMM